VQWLTTKRCAGFAAELEELKERLSVHERTMDDDGLVTSD
jgi:hypothetical protein